MNSPDPGQKKPGARPPKPAESTPGSGEGADTALQILIRRRKLVEPPEAPETEPPAPPGA